MQISEAAYRSLVEIGHPAHLRDIVQHIKTHGYFEFGAKSPERALGVAMDRRSQGVPISKPVLPFLFYRHAPATYWLLEKLTDDKREDLALEAEIDVASAAEQVDDRECQTPLGIARFDFDCVNQAPTTAGIYAWYAKLDAGVADYRRTLATDGLTDLGGKHLRQFLLRHSHKFAPTPYHATAKASFELTWTGKLEPQLATSLERVLGEEGLDELGEKERKQAERIQLPFRREKTRHLLVQLLKHATPFLAAPIYIGTSDNLRRRLVEHTRAILQLRDIIARAPEKREEILQSVRDGKATNFAGRTTALELGPTELEAYTLDVRRLCGAYEVTTEELESLATCVEWLLNRWHRPLAGRI
jgi:hypothetical protein